MSVGRVPSQREKADEVGRLESIWWIVASEESRGGARGGVQGGVRAGVVVGGEGIVWEEGTMERLRLIEDVERRECDGRRWVAGFCTVKVIGLAPNRKTLFFFYSPLSVFSGPLLVQTTAIFFFQSIPF